MLSGDNSILSRAGEARDKTEFAKVKEEIALAQVEAVVNQYLGGSSQTIEAQVLAKLTAAGYTIGSENSGTIQGINLSSNSVTIEEGGNTTGTAPATATADCVVTIKTDNHIADKSYVDYNVSYTDVDTGTEYTSDTGWRLLTPDDWYDVLSVYSSGRINESGGNNTRGVRPVISISNVKLELNGNVWQIVAK